jgi:hypothetical protein
VRCPGLRPLLVWLVVMAGAVWGDERAGGARDWRGQGLGPDLRSSGFGNGNVRGGVSPSVFGFYVEVVEVE